MDVAAFYREYDRHPGDRVRLFSAVGEFAQPGRVLYPGSYVDVAASAVFDDVVYVDMDKRAARFFSQPDDVDRLIKELRPESARAGDAEWSFHHGDYRDLLPVEDHSVDLLVSLYAGFISEHCSRYLEPGGHLLANNSHGDASMASIDSQLELVAVVVSGRGKYRVSDAALDSHLIPKKAGEITVEALHEVGRGVAYTKPAYAYIFKKTGAQP